MFGNFLVYIVTLFWEICFTKKLTILFWKICFKKIFKNHKTTKKEGTHYTGGRFSRYEEHIVIPKGIIN